MTRMRRNMRLCLRVRNLRSLYLVMKAGQPGANRSRDEISPSPKELEDLLTKQRAMVSMTSFATPRLLESPLCRWRITVHVGHVGKHRSPGSPLDRNL